MSSKVSLASSLSLVKNLQTAEALRVSGGLTERYSELSPFRL